MSCCCPTAVTALFCLWCQTGCNKGTVAGALTFFPPEPALYRFERRARDGRVLGDDEEADEKKDDDKQDLTTVQRNSDDSELGEIEGPVSTGPLNVETKGQTKEKMKSPIEQLIDQNKERRRRAKGRNARDARDAAAGVKYKLLLDPRLHVPSHEVGSIEAVKIPAKRGVYVAAVIYRLPTDRRNAKTKTMIYSHGNATDVGAMFPIQVVLAHSLDCNVVVYDYSGYGESGGVPDERNTYNDIDAVYDYVLDEVVDNGDAKNIVLYGQSVGSGPCCYLVSKNAVIGGLILHSPFTSGMRVLTPSRLLGCLDIYPNIDYIKKVNCPVMVIHGRLDQEVDVSHGVEMHKAVPEHLRREPWWVPDRGHNDIPEGPGKLAEYIRRLRTFLSNLDE